MPKKSKNTQPAPEEADDVNIISFDTFDLENRFALKAIPIKDQKERTQFLCFPKYSYTGDPEGEYDSIIENGEPALIVTDEIVINKGGIPRYNTKYHSSPDDMGRAYFYIAYDETCPGSVELFNWIRQIDDYFDEEINKNENKNEVVCYTTKNKAGKEMRKPFKGLTYRRIISLTRKPKTFEEDLEDDDAPKKEYQPYERIKCKFSTVWDDNLGPNDLKEIDTTLFVPNNDDPVDASKVSDFAKHFTWKSTCKFGLMLNKFWIDKSDERNCSFGLKCVQLAVTKARPDSGNRKTATSQLSRSLFTGKRFSRASPKEDEEENAEERDEEENEEVDEDEDELEVDEDEVDEDEDEVDEDEDEDVDEDEDDEDEDEDEDDEDEDEDDEDEESEEPAPKRRTTKKGASKGKKAPVKVKGKKGNSKAKRTRK